ncbi:MAG: substrate-binding domain-containing protein [Rhodobacteraceae bacterium]|nr:substrate-binding domain-containing protein [Paracoccaceae bacterium]
MARVSLKDLAKHLGLAEGTVSRAMNNYPDISMATREKVKKAADALGYRPNNTARRLATGRAEAVAYLMPTSHSAISTPFVSQLLQGLGDALAMRGWDLMVVQPQAAEDELETLRKLVASGKVSGVVMSRPSKSDSRIEFLKKSGFPFIVHGRSRDAEGYAWYDVDGRQAFADAVDHLASLGHQRIGFIGAPSYLNFAQDRVDGYKDGLVANGITFDPDLISVTELTDEGGERAALDLLNDTAPPSALLCVNDVQAIGALSAIRNKGLVPGEDVSVIGYDGVWMGRHTNPPLTTLAQPQAHSGRQLGDMLLSIIDGGNPTDFQVLRRAELVRRKSDGPPRALTPKIQTNSREEIS